jgi:hypothetical protein
MTGKKSKHKAARKPAVPGLPEQGKTARQEDFSPEETRAMLELMANEVIDNTMRKLYPSAQGHRAG